MSDRQRQTIVLIIAAWLADGVALVAAILLFSPLVQQLGEPSGANALLICTAFVLFCTGVYLMRKLCSEGEVIDPDSVISSRVRGLLALLFALAISAAIAHQLGYFASVQVTGIGDINEGAMAAFYAFAPGAWLGLAFIYVLVFAFPVRPTLSFPTFPYLAAALFGLFSHQLMLMVMAAEIMSALPGLLSFWWLLLFVALLLMLFMPPRIMYAARFVDRHAPLFISALVSLLLPILYYALLGIRLVPAIF